MPRANIHTRGLGQSQPVASNKTQAGRAQNRRVSVIIVV
jgi:outer membrane protein OmpA-like peptidoglycan-associated protein